MRNFWKYVSYLGVKSDMPFYMQKSIIMFNQLIRILIAILVVVIFSVLLFIKISQLALLFAGALLVLSFSLYLNSKSIVKASVFLVSISGPLILSFGSAYLKSKGIGNSLMLFHVPRIGLIIICLIPAAIFGFHDIKTAIGAMLTGILCFAFFEQIHSWFGINIAKIPYLPKHNVIFPIGLSMLLIFMVFLTFFLQNISSTYEKITLKQKEEIESQRDYVVKQRDQIAEQNEKITNSIVYAKRIQNALLAEPAVLQNHFAGYFILFQPRDIVSGDFYWLKQVNEKIIIVAADCTGHGVPGAFVSMLGIALLNETVHKKNLHSAAGLLEILREKIKKSLQQTGTIQEQKDGMDVSLCIFSTQDNSLEYAGAHNPLYIIRTKNAEKKLDFSPEKVRKMDFQDYTLTQIKANPQPIGISRKEKPFTNHKIDLLKGDKIYLFTDGYPDQIGGTSGDKFKTKYFKQYLLEIHHQPMEVQQELLNKKMKEWRGDLQPQVDDMLIIGLEIL